MIPGCALHLDAPLQSDRETTNPQIRHYLEKFVTAKSETNICISGTCLHFLLTWRSPRVRGPRGIHLFDSRHKIIISQCAVRLESFWVWGIKAMMHPQTVLPIKILLKRSSRMLNPRLYILFITFIVRKYRSDSCQFPAYWVDNPQSPTALSFYNQTRPMKWLCGVSRTPQSLLYRDVTIG